jgi:PAS domain S-box-containing protein
MMPATLVKTLRSTRAAQQIRQASAERAGEAPAVAGSRLFFALIVAVASAPAAGILLAATWLFVVLGLIAGEQQWFLSPGARARRAGQAGMVFSWLHSAAYSTAAMYLVLFHTGAAQTFGVTLYGVIMFQILVRDYARPRCLVLNLIPPVLTMALVQLAATVLRIGQGRPLEIITLLASPLVVFWVFRAVQQDLTRNRARWLEAATRAEAGTRDIEEAHRVAMMAEDLAGIGHWRLDVPSQVTAWSEGVFRVFGLKPSQDTPCFEDIVRLFEPDCQALVLEAHAKLVKTGASFTLEGRIRRADGETRHVTCNGAAERNSSGEVETLFGTIMDVTESRMREAVLQESETRYRMLTERATDVIIRYDPTGEIEFASPSVQQFGFAPKDLVGRNMADFIHPDHQAGTLQVRTDVTQGRALAMGDNHEFQARRADGEWIWLQGNPAPIRDASGKIIAAVTVLRDITAHKAMEEELRRKRAEAEAATVAKAEFLANMSHEIRTPLTGIIGFSGLLGHMDGLPDMARSYVRRIATSGEALLDVVNDILDFSKLEAGQVMLDPQPFDVHRFFENTMAMVSGQADAKGLAHTLDIGAETPAALVADSGRLRQVVVNLLGNAIKFTDAGSVRVAVNHDAKADQLRVAVSDTGAGVPKDRLDRLFRRFSQVDGSITRRYGGTGLGLSICKTLVELMGGDIAVESAEGAGSTFSFWVSVKAVDVDWVERDTAFIAEETETRPARILVVDDLGVNRELVRAVLEAAGHTVDEAAGGAEAVQTADQGRFDLIFMDLQMPGMDGCAAARAIRNLGSPSRLTPIVALSANVLPEQVRASEAAGMNDHVGKPILPTELLGAVTRWAHVQLPEASAALAQSA